MTTLSARFGRTIRRLRIEAGLSQEKFAEQAGVSRNFQGSVERGESSLSLDVAGHFARTLGMSLSQLLAVVEDGRTHGGDPARKRVKRS